MLVLSRFTDQSIIIDGRIKLMIVEVRGDKVRLGIEAPPEVTVDREEVHARKQREAAAVGCE